MAASLFNPARLLLNVTASLWTRSMNGTTLTACPETEPAAIGLPLRTWLL
jgi:hypothetical protein